MPKKKDYEYAQVPISTVTIQINTDNIHKIIKIEKEKKYVVSLGDIIIKSLANSLKNYSVFNATYEEEILKKHENINIGYFINVGKGTKLLSLKNTEKKTLKEISRKIKDLALKYIHDELTEEDTSNTTICITNVSAFKSYSTAPPILKTHVAMLSIASEFSQLETQEGKIVSVKKMNLTLSYDARIASCQKALKFLHDINAQIQKMTT